MSDFELMELLGRAFAYGEIDNLKSRLAPDCVYESDYARRTVKTADEIVKMMKKVSSNITDECRYTYQIVSLDDILQNGMPAEWDLLKGAHVHERGLLLFQFSDKFPAAVVMAALDGDGRIVNILLSCNADWFKLDFYRDQTGADAPDDLPSTVSAMTPDNLKVREMRSYFSGQHLDDMPEEIGEGPYVWKKADAYCKTWLAQKGYSLLESRIFADCIGYRCKRKNLAYTVYMYAYGKQKTVELDGKTCKKFLDFDFSQNSTVLVTYLNVKRFWDEDHIAYKVCHCNGNDDMAPELWRVTELNGKPILQYFPSKEIIDATFKLMYAFNHDSLDAYDCIVCDRNPKFSGADFAGSVLNRAFYTNLRGLHKKYGQMKYGYVRYNDAVYSATPYLEGYGFFSFFFDYPTNRITDVTARPFDGGKREVAEYIKTDKRESGSWFADYPRLVEAEALPPVKTERFALKLTFDNGEIRKYVLPILGDDESEEVISYRDRVFTDKIWQSATVVDHQPAEYKGYARRGAAVVFKNGFFLSGLLCYQESEVYSEPIRKSKLLFEDASCRLERLWIWSAQRIFEDEETGFLKVLLSGDAFNSHGVSTFASRDGKRLCSINFDYIGDFSEGVAAVGKHGLGMGFVDRDMNFVVPMIYDAADEFKDGRAKVERDGRWLFVDKTGKEFPLALSDPSSPYQEVGSYSEGMCKVSTLKLRYTDLAYHSDYSEIAGTWGFVNEAGEEVIPPQYIYAEDFSGGMAIVCKGKWTIDKKWDNEYNTGCYWTDEALWGAIDPAGNTAIPFIFDEIRHFLEPETGIEEAFMAHYGGWEKGHWGVIDRRGNWLAEPVFADIDYEYSDGLFAFCMEDRWENDSVPLGIYDTKQKKVIFEPQFLDVSFLKDGSFEVEVFDEKLGRTVEKIIDRKGKERFGSVYSSIYTWAKPYEVVIQDENGKRHGLIDENGKVLLPCEHDVPWAGISYAQKKMIFSEQDKCGIKDFDGNILVPPIYDEIDGIDKPLYIVRVADAGDFKAGMIAPDGTVVIPTVFSSIRWGRDDYIACCRDGHCEMLRLISKTKPE